MEDANLAIELEEPDDMEDEEVKENMSSGVAEMPNVKAFSRRGANAGSVAKPGSPKQVRQTQLKSKAEDKKVKEETKEAGGGKAT